jgi:hypothetical protein
VLQGSQSLGLVQEPRPRLGGGDQLGLDDLQCDRPLQGGIVRPEDDTHAATAQHAQHAEGAKAADFLRILGRRQEWQPIVGNIVRRPVIGRLWSRGVWVMDNP